MLSKLKGNHIDSCLEMTSVEGWHLGMEKSAASLPQNSEQLLRELRECDALQKCVRIP